LENPNEDDLSKEEEVNSNDEQDLVIDSESNTGSNDEGGSQDIIDPLLPITPNLFN